LARVEFDTNAFAGFASGWEIGNYYVIRIGQPQGSAPVTITKRSVMESGETYNLCPDDANKLCGGAF
jgi:hypothetical protein